MEELAQKIQEIDINHPETQQGTKTSHRNLTGNRNIKSITDQITHDYTKLPKDGQSLNVLYANVKSIKKKGKIDELKCILKMIPKTVHLILLTESWTKTDDGDASLELENYNLVTNSRNDKKGGGVAAYIRKNIQYSTEDLYKNGNNYLWIHLEELELHFGLVYYPGNTSEKVFRGDFKSELQKRKDHHGIIVGDFNIDGVNGGNSRAFKKILKVLKDAGFEILNNTSPEYFTRKNLINNNVTKTSTIDHVWSNLGGEYHLALIDSSLSDHRQLYFEIRNAGLSPNDREENALTSTNSYWSSLSEAKNNKDYPVVDAINKVNSKNFRPSDWITEEISKGITTRNRFHQLYQDKPNEKTKRLFDKAKMRAKDLVEVKKSELEILTLIKSDINKKIIPSKLTVDSKNYTDSKEICEQFDIYFSKITGLENYLPDQSYMHSGVDTRSKQNYNTNRLSKMPHCTSQEISKIIASLDPNASAGIDGTNVESIKGPNKDICNDLSACFNYCFDSGIFPDCLKISKVIPVHNSGSKSEVRNYTFQWVASVFSRIFEKLLWKRIISAVPVVFYVTENQYGYREKPNTVAPTIDLTSKIITSMDKKQSALGLFIHLKEALKQVNHSLLLKKIGGFGINGLALQIIESYFINRKCVVSTGTFEANPRDIKQGVPQGSVLGHLLFLLYINEVRTLNLNGNITVSAENISLFYYGVEIKDLLETAQQDLNSLSVFFKDNGSGVNPNEISYVIFTRKRINKTYKLDLSGIQISQAAQTEYFGLILDSKLTWKAHVSKIKSILKLYHEHVKTIGRCPQSHGLLFYNTYVRPYTDYLIELWGRSSVSNIKKLQGSLTTLERKLNVVETEHILSLKQNIIYKTCILVYKIMHQDITELSFKTNKDVTNRELRSKNLLRLPEARTKHGKMSLSYAGAETYNGLAEDVRNADNRYIFKKELRSYLGIEKKRERRQQKQDTIVVNNSTGAASSNVTNAVYQCILCETHPLFETPRQRKDHKEEKHQDLKKNTRVFERMKL